MKQKHNTTNELTKQILEYLFREGAFVWRNNSLPVPITVNGRVVGYRPGSKSGVPDIVGCYKGRWLGIEVKTSKDRLSDVQRAFIANMKRVGGLVYVAHDFESFVEWFEQTKKTLENKSLK